MFQRLTSAFAFVALLTAACGQASAEPVVRMSAVGAVSFEDGVVLLVGRASHLGNFTGFGEIVFDPGDGGLLVGEGIVALEAANGDCIVGTIEWVIGGEGDGAIAFSWRDAIQFSDGTVAESSGRFIESRPRGTLEDTENELSELDEQSLKALLNDLKRYCQNRVDDTTCQNTENFLLGILAK